MPFQRSKQVTSFASSSVVREDYVNLANEFRHLAPHAFEVTCTLGHSRADAVYLDVVKVVFVFRGTN
jgi:hypothetical protein